MFFMSVAYAEVDRTVCKNRSNFSHCDSRMNAARAVSLSGVMRPALSYSSRYTASCLAIVARSLETKPAPRCRDTDIVCWNRPKTMENGFFVLAV